MLFIGKLGRVCQDGTSEGALPQRQQKRVALVLAKTQPPRGVLSEHAQGSAAQEGDCGSGKFSSLLVGIWLEKRSLSPGKGNAGFSEMKENGLDSSKGYFSASVTPCNHIYTA